MAKRAAPSSGQIPADLPAPLRRQLALSRAALLAERLARAFWPLFSLVLVLLSALMLGLHDRLSPPTLRILAGLALTLMLAALGYGLWRFRWPRRDEALARLEAPLPTRPLSALRDRQAIGADDPASRALWQAHLRRMAEQARRARAAPPRPDLPPHDPFALRHLALTFFVIALIFGAPSRLADLPRALQGLPGGGLDLAAGPAWEGWLRPPAHTGKPTLYLPDQPAGTLRVPVGSRALIRLYGTPGSLRIAEDLQPEKRPGLSGPATGAGADEGTAPVTATAPASDAAAGTGAPGAPRQGAQREFTIARSGSLAIEGPGGRAWQVEIIPDLPPEIALAGPLERRPGGEMRLPFTASDDYGVAGGQVRISLDLAAVDRRYGLAPPPEPRPEITLDLPLPYSGDRRQVEGMLVEELAKHPWAGLPVIMELSVTDAIGQIGHAEPAHVILPGRRFFDPLAAAIVEQRRDLLWSRANGARAARLLRAISNRPDGLFDHAADYLKLRHAIGQLEAALDAQGALAPAARDKLAGALWEIALSIEEGNLSDASERLRRARERLQQAMRDGASQSEIDELMREMQQAMRDYLRQLAEEQQGQQQNEQLSRQQGESMTITPDQLQKMLDRIQELMEQGRMAEAQQALDQLSQMLENMRIARGGSGQGGDQALGGLAETLRRQQDLSDETFRQMQRGGDGRQGRQQGQQGSDGQQQGQQQGQQGGTGQGSQGGPDGPTDGPAGETGRGGQPGPDGQGRGRPDAQPGPGTPGGNAPGAGQGGDGTGRTPGTNGRGDAPGGSLAERQQQLRRELERQLGTLPGDADEQTLQALRDAERAMREAERALRGGDGSGALDRQAEALQALREGLRGLARNLAENGSGESGQGRQGRGEGEGSEGRNLDPLGRSITGNGSPATGREMLGGADAARRARELMEEIRRRAADRAREQLERDYLQRLLERFGTP